MFRGCCRARSAAFRAGKSIPADKQDRNWLPRRWSHGTPMNFPACSCTIFAMLAFLSCTAGSRAGSAADFYVSPQGNDGWTGTAAAPSGSDGPFATIERPARGAPAQSSAEIGSSLCGCSSRRNLLLPRPSRSGRKTAAAPKRRSFTKRPGRGACSQWRRPVRGWREAAAVDRRIRSGARRLHFATLRQW